MTKSVFLNLVKNEMFKLRYAKRTIKHFARQFRESLILYSSVSCIYTYKKWRVLIKTSDAQEYKLIKPRRLGARI